MRIFFVQFFCVFLPPLNIFCFCWSYYFCPLSSPSLHKMFPWYLLIFLKRSLVFPILLIDSVSLHWSLRKALLSLLAILWNSEFRCLHLSFSPLLFASLLFTAICKASPDNHFAFLHFFPWGWSWSLCPVQYHEPLSIVHQESFYLKKTMVDLQCCINFCCTAKGFSYTYIYAFFFKNSFSLWPNTGYWILFPVLYSMTLFIHSLYNGFYLLTPNSQSPLPPSPLATTSLFSVSLFLFHR